MHSADVMMLGNSLSCLHNHLTALSDTQARQSCLFTLVLGLDCAVSVCVSERERKRHTHTHTHTDRLSTSCTATFLLRKS